MDNALQKVDPQVLTKASPSAEDLLQVRADVQSHPHIKDLFRTSRKEGWDREYTVDQVATEVARYWPSGDPTEAVEFLVDEYAQLEQGLYLIDNTTGQVVAIIKEEDIYQPAMVPREGGGMAKPLPKIRPDLHGAIYLHLHDKSREVQVLADLLEHTPQTALLKEEGDPRLLAATRKGRRQVVTSLTQKDPKDLLKAVGGSTGAFARLFEVTSGTIPLLTELTGRVNAKTSMATADQTTLNIRHNRVNNLPAYLTHDWIRGIARDLSLKAHQGMVAELDDSSPLPGVLIVTPPELLRMVRKRNPKIPILPVEGAKLTSILASPGYLKVPESFVARNFDAFDRWDVYAELEYTLYYEPDLVVPLSLPGVEPEVQVL